MPNQTVTLPHIIMKEALIPPMKLSIYRKVEDVLPSANKKSRWQVIDYSTKSGPIHAVGVDLELEYWSQSVAVGEVILLGDRVWFSDTTDADRFESEFLPSIEERMKTQSFVKPFDDLYELLEYAKAGNSVKLETVVPVRFQDFFYSDEGAELSENGVALWFMLRAGCTGRLFYFSAENSFGFENEGDAILFAAFLTETDKAYGDEVPVELPAAKRAKKQKKTVDDKALEQAKMDYIQKMAEIIQQQREEEYKWKSWRPMWGSDPGNLPYYDLTGISIGDAYDPNDGATSLDRPWPKDRDDLRGYLKNDPRLLRRSASATLKASLLATGSSGI